MDEKNERYQRLPLEQTTLRDRFAMAALQGMLAYSHVNSQSGNWVENCSPRILAYDAYQYADEMLAARATPPEGESE